jgi:hypothetical protein
VLEKNKDKIEASGKRLYMSLSAGVHRFLKKRIRTDLIYPLVSAVKKDGKPQEIIFTTGFVSKDKLILIYLAQPTLSGKKTQEELETITPMLNEAVALTSTRPTTLALHLERQNVQFQPASESKSLKTEIIVVIPQASMQVEPFSIPENLPGRVMWLDSLLGIMDELEDDEDEPRHSRENEDEKANDRHLPEKVVLFAQGPGKVELEGIVFEVVGDEPAGAEGQDEHDQEEEAVVREIGRKVLRADVEQTVAPLDDRLEILETLGDVKPR